MASLPWMNSMRPVGFLSGLRCERDGKIDNADWAILRDSLSKGENVAMAVKPGGRGDITQTHVAWKVTRGLPYVASPLLYQGRLYMFKNGGMLSSSTRKPGMPSIARNALTRRALYSSPIAADGRIYVASLAGKLTVIKAGGAKPEILPPGRLRRTRLCFASPGWRPPLPPHTDKALRLWAISLSAFAGRGSRSRTAQSSQASGMAAISQISRCN
jgi:hypothetical protein